MLPSKKLECEKSDAPQHHPKDSRTSVGERMILILFFLMIITMLIIAAWSAILLLSGTAKGGGPLGMIMNALPMDLLLEQ